MQMCKNEVSLCGRVRQAPAFSHESHGRRFYVVMLETERLSGTVDSIRLLINQEQKLSCAMEVGTFWRVEGHLRSFNNKTSAGSKLIIAVLARNIVPGVDGFENGVRITGTLCKMPVYRRTPLGREICDMIVAVNRQHGRADYLPVISWGAGARQCAACRVGDQVEIEGRIQSREYIKVTEEGETTKTAFEISVSHIQILNSQLETEKE